MSKGKTRQTIRARRKDGRHAESGYTLQLYTGMRTFVPQELRADLDASACL